MVMRIGSANLMVEKNLKKKLPDEKLAQDVAHAYYAGEMREFIVTVETVDGVKLNSTFTATTIIQLTNQRWVKSIVTRNAARMC